MALGEIGGRPGRRLQTYFGRRGPWAAHFARSGNIPKQPCAGSNAPMGPWPGEFQVIRSVGGSRGVGASLGLTNSPGHGPIGVLDPSLGCVLKVPRPRKVGAPGPSAAKVGATRSRQPRANLPQGHGDLVFAMDPVDAFTIIPKNEMI